MLAYPREKAKSLQKDSIASFQGNGLTQVFYIFNVKLWVFVQVTQNTGLMLVNHAFLKGSLWVLPLSFTWRGKLHPLWCNPGTLDIYPEPIMNLDFCVELGFATWDSEGSVPQFSQTGVL